MSFPTTNWAQVAQATLNGDTRSREALARLCTDYRAPLLAFLCSRGYDRHGSEDLVQEFFMQLLTSQAWKRADQARGRFRSFLLATLMHVTDHANAKASAVKRGGGCSHDSLETMEKKGIEVGAIPAEIERRFDSEWAFGLIQNTMHALAAEFDSGGRAEEFAALRCFLPGAEVPPAYDQLSVRLGQTEAGLRIKVHRLRQRFRELLRAAVARTVSAPHEVDEELAYLRSLLFKDA